MAEMEGQRRFLRPLRTTAAALDREPPPHVPGSRKCILKPIKNCDVVGRNRPRTARTPIGDATHQLWDHWQRIIAGTYIYRQL